MSSVVVPRHPSHLCAPPLAITSNVSSRLETQSIQPQHRNHQSFLWLALCLLLTHPVQKFPWLSPLLPLTSLASVHLALISVTRRTDAAKARIASSATCARRGRSRGERRIR